MAGEKIEIENSPGWTERVDKAKFTAMRDALLSVLQTEPPGMKAPDAKAALLPHLPEDLFPGDDKAGWWLKAAQLDLEVKGTIARAEKPLVRLYRIDKPA